MLWSQYAYNTSGLVIPVISDNIHEARAFNRLARMARGEIIVSAQDDHQYPDSCDWLHEALRVFKAYPRIGLLGLRRRTLCFDVGLCQCWKASLFLYAVCCSSSLPDSIQIIVCCLKFDCCSS